MKVPDYKPGDPMVDEHGNEVESLEDYIHGTILGYCACGSPGSNLDYILHGLRLINEKPPKDFSENIWQEWYPKHEERLKAHFTKNGSEYFFYYWCDKEGLTEHGGSVPGWLDSDGERLLAILELWDKEVTER
jgi:hypothetical protein